MNLTNQPTVPTIAVMPCVSLGGAAEEILTAQSLVEDLCAELGRYPTLRVIAAPSSALVAEQTDAEAAARLGATHVLRSTLRPAGGQLRVTATLVDPASATAVWSQRFDTSAEALFDAQDEIVARCATALNARLEDVTLRRARGRPTESLVAYELWLRGRAMLRQERMDTQARALFERAIEIDAQFARAYAGISLSWFNESSCQYWDTFQENGNHAYEYAHRALELDESDPLLHFIVGRMLVYWREYERASWYFDRALEINSNDAELLANMCIYQSMLGHHDVSVQQAEKAMVLHPLHPNYYWAYALYPYFFARQIDKAVVVGAKIEGLPVADFPAVLAMTYMLHGDTASALQQFATFERVYSERIAPGQATNHAQMREWLFTVNPLRRREDVDFMSDAWDRVLRAGRRTREIPSVMPGAPSSATASLVPAPMSSEASLVASGKMWMVEFDGRSVALPAMKGLQDLQKLLAHPGELVHCLDLAERSAGMDPGSEVLDDAARRDYQARIRQLQEDLAEAEDDNDIGRAESLRSELDQLVVTLSAALGLGGRSRRMGDLAERARSTVTRRVRHSIGRIESVHPELGRHLHNAVRTGVFCSYRPESPTRWRLTADAG